MDKNEYEEEVIETLEETETVETTEETEEEEKDYKALYEAEVGRRKRAETEAKKAKETKQPQPKEEVKTSNILSTADTLALARAGIEDDELGIVEKYAKFEGISIKDALNSPIVKIQLEEKREFKKSKEVSNVDSKRSGQAKISDEQIISKARANKDLSAEELKRLAWQ